MKPLIVYFHGYGSSASSDKVSKLKEMGLDVYAWNIDIDPKISIPYLDQEISNLLHDHLTECDLNIKFIGTSLGAWYANLFSHMYNIPSILINPSHFPQLDLIRFGVPSYILNRYKPSSYSSLSTIVIAKDDELIDHDIANLINAKRIIYSDTGGHRFNGSEFELLLKELL